MTTKTKSILIVLATICLLFVGTTPLLVSATSNETVQALTNESTSTEFIEANGQTSTSTVDADAGLARTTVKEIQSKVNEKGFDLVHILQTFGKPFAIVCFIAAALYSMVALLMKNGSLGKGCLAMFIAAVVYGLIAAAPQIVQLISNWIQS